MKQELLFQKQQQSNTGYYILASFGSSPDHALFSNDGGQTFSQVIFGNNDHLRAHWIAPDRSVAIASHYRTLDATIQTTFDGVNWIKHTNTGGTGVTDMSGTYDGQYIIITSIYGNNYNSYASIDKGQSFYTLSNLNRKGRGCVSDDGNYIYVAGNESSYMYYRHSPLDGSGDETFNQNSLSFNTLGCYCNSTGKYVFCSNRSNGDIYISSDHGQTFTFVYNTGESAVRPVAHSNKRMISSDGKYSIFRTHNGSKHNKLFISTDTFSSFTNIYTGTGLTHLWTTFYEDLSVILVTDQEYLKISTDYGSTWQDLLHISGANLRTPHISNDGNFIALFDVDNQTIYFSDDGGSNFSSYVISSTSETFYGIIAA